MDNSPDRLDLPKLTTGEVLGQSLKNIIEGVTGILGSQRSEWFLTLGHLLQRVRSGKFLSTLFEEWSQYCDKGRVEDSYMFTVQHQECLQEILDFLDHDSPDEVRFTILKKIFLSTASESVSNRDSLLPQQYMRLCRSLTSGEAVLLLAVYSTVREGPPPQRHTSAQDWLEHVAKRSSLEHIELVELCERGLIDKRLLTPRLHSDRSGITQGDNYRMTDLALGVCGHIEAYDSLESK